MDNRYEGNTTNHLNLVCLQCGSIQDFTEDLPFPGKIVEAQTGFHAIDTRMEYYGYCRECKTQKR
jgi:Fur family transcriptional regulator, peroxide stress response regulator